MSSSSLLQRASLIPLLLSPLFAFVDYPGIKFALSFDDISDEDSPVPLVGFLLISIGIDTFFLLLAFNTANEATTVIFLLMVYGSFIALLFLRVYFGAGEDEEPLSFDKNPGWKGFFIGILLGLIVLILNVTATSFSLLSVLHSGFVGGLQGIDYNSMIFVPKFFSTAQAGQFSTLDNAVFEIILTAPGEEGLKASMLYGMYALTGSELVAVLFSTLVWASFHTIVVGFTPIEVLLAFMSGLIWWAGWKWTGSLLVPVVSHGVYDSVLVVLASIH